MSYDYVTISISCILEKSYESHNVNKMHLRTDTISIYISNEVLASYYTNRKEITCIEK